MLILEELEHAQRRGAPIYAELVGYGSSADAYHITAPSEDGDGARRVMRMAIRKAGIAPERGRLHQRARHLDAVQRQARDAGHQALLRRARAQAGDLVDQVDDRPPARRRRRPRGRHHARSRCTTSSCRRRSTSTTPIPSATSTTCRTRAGRCRSGTRCRTRSASAAPTRRCCSRSSRGDFAYGPRRRGDAEHRRSCDSGGFSLRSDSPTSEDADLRAPRSAVVTVKDATNENRRLHQAGPHPRVAAAAATTRPGSASRTSATR